MAKGRGVPQAVADILRRRFPERRGVILEGVPGEGYVEGYGWPEEGTRLDMRPAEEALGREPVGFEESIMDTVKVFETIYAKELKKLAEGKGEEGMRGDELKTNVPDGEVA